METTVRDQLNMIEAHTRILDLAIRLLKQDSSYTAMASAVEKKEVTLEEVLDTYNKMVETMYAQIYTEEK